jgi:hypothetical protein
MGWYKARNLLIEINSKCMKYKESAHMADIMGPVGHMNLEISPIWFPLISKQVASKRDDH